MNPLISRLFGGEEVVIPLSTGIHYSDLAKDSTTFLSLLYFSGHLTNRINNNKRRKTEEILFYLPSFVYINLLKTNFLLPNSLVSSLLA